MSLDNEALPATVTDIRRAACIAQFCAQRLHHPARRRHLSRCRHADNDIARAAFPSACTSAFPRSPREVVIAVAFAGTSASPLAAAISINAVLPSPDILPAGFSLFSPNGLATAFNALRRGNHGFDRSFAANGNRNRDILRIGENEINFFIACATGGRKAFFCRSRGNTIFIVVACYWSTPDTHPQPEIQRPIANAIRAQRR